jgi:hypothetical protein
MRPTQRSPFGAGGPLTPKTAAAKLALALLGGSVVAALAGDLGVWLLLVPQWVVTRFAVWELFTYTFIATNPLGVIFGVLITWMIGGALEASWGPRRTLTFAIGTTVLAGLLTTLVALFWGAVWARPFAGGTVLTTVVWVGYGLAHGRSQMNFWGIPLTGNHFAAIGIGFVALNAVFSRSLVPVVPEVFAILLTFAYLRLGSPRMSLLRLKRWRHERELRARARHLRVISQDQDKRSGDKGSDRFLH